MQLPASLARCGLMVAVMPADAMAMVLAVAVVVLVVSVVVPSRLLALEDREGERGEAGVLPGGVDRDDQERVAARLELRRAQGAGLEADAVYAAVSG